MYMFFHLLSRQQPEAQQTLSMFFILCSYKAHFSLLYTMNFFISFNKNKNKPSWIYLFHNGLFSFLPSEIELCGNRKGSWCAEADIISTGSIPVILIQQVIAPCGQSHRLSPEMGIPRNAEIYQCLSANFQRLCIACCIPDQCGSRITQPPDEA